MMKAQSCRILNSRKSLHETLRSRKEGTRGDAKVNKNTQGPQTNTSASAGGITNELLSTSLCTMRVAAREDCPVASAVDTFDVADALPS